MVAGNSRLMVQSEGDIVRVGFVDRNILEEGVIQQIGMEIGQIIEESTNPKVLISFTDVEHLSSAALGMLITINNRIRQKAGQLRLSDIDPQIFEVFTITKLDKLFQIYDESDEAVASFK